MFVDIEGAARLLGVSGETVRAMIRAGSLLPCRKKTMIPLKDIERMIEEGWKPQGRGRPRKGWERETR